MTPRNDVVPDISFSAASNALRISYDTVPGIGEDKSGEVQGNFEGGKKWQPNDGSMGSTVYLLILMQHVVPELGLAEVIVATLGSQRPPIRLQPAMAKCIQLQLQQLQLQSIKFTHFVQ